MKTKILLFVILGVLISCSKPATNNPTPKKSSSTTEKLQPIPPNDVPSKWVNVPGGIMDMHIYYTSTVLVVKNNRMLLRITSEYLTASGAGNPANKKPLVADEWYNRVVVVYDYPNNQFTTGDDFPRTYLLQIDNVNVTNTITGVHTVRAYKYVVK